MATESYWFWQQPIDPLAVLAALLDLPVCPASDEQRPVRVTLDQGAEAPGAFLVQVCNGTALRSVIQERQVLPAAIEMVSTVNRMLAYLPEPDRPFCVSPVTLSGSIVVCRDRALMSHGNDFPEAFYPDADPDRPLPPEVLAELRARYLPLTQAFWVVQLCAIASLLRPAVMVSAREMANQDERRLWTGSGLRCRIPARSLVLAYVREGVPVKQMPSGLRTVRFLEGTLHYNADILCCDVPAAVSRVSAPDYRFACEWDAFHRGDSCGE